MNIGPSSTYSLTHSTTHPLPFPTQNAYHWPWPNIIIPSSTTYFKTSTFTTSEQLTYKKWEELKDNNNYSKALQFLNQHQGKSIYVTALKIETLRFLQSTEKITSIYLDKPNDTYDPRTLFIISKAFFDRNEFDKAFECIQRVIALDESNPGALIFAGVTCCMLNKIELFEEYFQKGISLAKKLQQTELEHQCYHTLAREQYKLGKVDQALEQLNQLPGTYSDAVALKSYIFAQQKKEDQAITLLEKVLELPVPAQLKIVGDNFKFSEKDNPVFFILTYICYTVARIVPISQEEDQFAWLRANQQRFHDSVLEFPKDLNRLNLLSSVRILVIILTILQKEKNANACVAFLDAWNAKKYIDRSHLSIRTTYLISAGRIEEAEETFNKLSEPLSTYESSLKMHLCVLRNNEESAWELSCDSFDENETDHFKLAVIYLQNKGKHSLEKGNLIYAIAGYLHLHHAVHLGQFKAVQDPALFNKGKKGLS